MKKNLSLFFILFILLIGTYYLVEVKPNSQAKIEDSWKLTVEGMKSLQLMKTQFKETTNGWQDVDGLKPKQDLLLEFSKILASFKFHEFIESQNEAHFFSDPVTVTINELTVTIGDLTATGEKFYLKKAHDSRIYLIPLDQIPSQVIGETEQQLNFNKWVHIRDFILAPKDDWQEKRLAVYDDIGGFDEIRLEDYSLKNDNTETSLFSQLNHRLGELKWIEVREYNQKINDEYRISFWLKEKKKSEWIITKDQHIIFPHLGKSYLISDSNWLHFWDPLFQNDGSKVIWSPFRLCGKKNLKDYSHKVLCPVGFEVTPVNQVDKIKK